MTCSVLPIRDAQPHSQLAHVALALALVLAVVLGVLLEGLGEIVGLAQQVLCLLSAEAGPLTSVPERAYAGFEATMDVLCRTRPVSALCKYDRRTTGTRLRETVAILGLAGGAAHGEQRW